MVMLMVMAMVMPAMVMPIAMPMAIAMTMAMVVYLGSNEATPGHPGELRHLGGILVPLPCAGAARQGPPRIGNGPSYMDHGVSSRLALSTPIQTFSTVQSRILITQG